MTVYLQTKYEDDVLPISKTSEPATRWRERQITYHLKDILDDFHSGKSKQEITFCVLRDAANSSTPYLGFMGEFSEDGAPISVLDT